MLIKLLVYNIMYLERGESNEVVSIVAAPNASDWILEGVL